MRATISVTPPPPMAPAAPTNLQVTSAPTAGSRSRGRRRPTRAAIPTADESQGDSTFSQIASGLTVTTFTDASVVVGQNYQYEVLATNNAGTSPPAPPVAASIPNPGTTLAVTVGKGVNKSVQFFNDAGTLTTIELTGHGTATVNFAASTISQATNKAGVVVSGTGITIVSITTTGTVLANSVLTVMTRGGTNSINLGGISSDGSLNAINAPTAMLSSTLAVAGGITRIWLGSVSGADHKRRRGSGNAQDAFGNRPGAERGRHNPQHHRHDLGMHQGDRRRQSEPSPSRPMPSSTFIPAYPRASRQGIAA